MGSETSVVMQDRLAMSQDMTQPIPHYLIKSSHNTYLTGRLHCCLFNSYIHYIWSTQHLRFFCLSPCSRSVLWCVLSGDVPSVSAVRLPLSGAGLLEGQTSRWRAHHYPRLHHDHWDPLQGAFTGRIHCTSFTFHSDVLNIYMFVSLLYISFQDLAFKQLGCKWVNEYKYIFQITDYYRLCNLKTKWSHVSHAMLSLTVDGKSLGL